MRLQPIELRWRGEELALSSTRLAEKAGVARKAIAAEGELVGRERERAALERVLGDPRAARGGIALIAGDAGMGKTRLAERVLQDRDVQILRGDASEQATAPYGPIAAALRTFLRSDPRGLEASGPLSDHLGVLLPELGDAPEGGDRATVCEALRCAFHTVARRRPVIVFLDDLHWADATTLELLPALVAALSDEPVLVLGAYRTDELSRSHPLRCMRAELRRAGRLQEFALGPLDPEQTTELATRVLGATPARSLARTIYDRTQGVPYFVEELCGALSTAGRVVNGRSGLELLAGGEIPVPDTVRDAVLMRVKNISHDARRVLDVASVAGMRFDLALVAEVAGDAAIDEPVAIGVVVEVEPGVAAFRHALTREAFYLDIRWGRRRALHRRLAELLEARGARPALVAEHWVAAREPARARPALLAAARDHEAAHAYRDALGASRRALELLSADDHEERVALLVRIGHYAELCGELGDAVLAWEEASDARRLDGDTGGVAELDRRLAVANELQGDWQSAIAAHQRAGQGFARVRRDTDAAAELLAAAAHLDGMGSTTPALELAQRAAGLARQSGRRDLVARSLGLEGSVRAKLGDGAAGIALAREGLSLALGENLTGAATELYLRLAAVLENAADLGGARQVYDEAYDFCVANGAPGVAQVCLVCLAYVLWETGRWDEAEALEREIIASPDSPVGVVMAAKSALAIFRTARGQTRGTRRQLVEGLSYASQNGRLRFEFNCLVGLAWLDELEGADASAAQRYHEIVRRRSETEDKHYAPMALRSAVTFFATHGDGAAARACAGELADMASATANPETLAALAHALGEVALLEGEPGHAVAEFGRAIDLLRELELPHARAHSQIRTAAAHAAGGEQQQAVDRLTDAYRTSRKLGAQPLAALAAGRLEELGERVDRRLGRRAASDLERRGLTRRELEVLRFVAVGRTNREIAAELFLSKRTVDMHVRSVLMKMSCNSRTEATRRAWELGLVD